MSAGKIRGKILVSLWASGKPMSLQEIAEKVGLTTSSTMGYLLGLIKAKYVSVPQKHSYAITVLGKQAIGMPKMDKNLASTVLGPRVENAFHFYYGIDQPADVHADSLKEFVNKIQDINAKSIEFHTARKDFENWIRALGDIELAKKIELLRMRQLSGDNLRKTVYATVNSRCEELAKLCT